MSVLLEAVHECSVTSQALSWPKGETVLGSHWLFATNIGSGAKLQLPQEEALPPFEAEGVCRWDLVSQRGLFPCPSPAMEDCATSLVMILLIGVSIGGGRCGA